ncbi:hypothetical protein [Subtercola boreus]|uniref:hypothetical protein n=1 Tax=Subtercola boreus TaxID=120213 RepID=UPI0011C01934|nr:hypothetical protein [Subtercola boreus]
MHLIAIDQLAREIPPAMLAGILGIPITAAARATARAGGSWANYYADRNSPAREPDPDGRQHRNPFV